MLDSLSYFLFQSTTGKTKAMVCAIFMWDNTYKISLAANWKE